MSGDKIVLTVRGLGHVPSFKNNKMMTRGKLITAPEKQKWIYRCIQSFESQLRSSWLMGNAEMLTGLLPRSLTPWLKHFDDSVEWIEEINVKVIRVPKGTEGAIIILERLPDKSELTEAQEFLDGNPQVL